MSSDEINDFAVRLKQDWERWLTGDFWKTRAGKTLRTIKILKFVDLDLYLTSQWVKLGSRNVERTLEDPFPEFDKFVDLVILTSAKLKAYGKELED